MLGSGARSYVIVFSGAPRHCGDALVTSSWLPPTGVHSAQPLTPRSTKGAVVALVSHGDRLRVAVVETAETAVLVLEAEHGDVFHRLFHVPEGATGHRLDGLDLAAHDGAHKVEMVAAGM